MKKISKLLVAAMTTSLVGAFCPVHAQDNGMSNANTANYNNTSPVFDGTPLFPANDISIDIFGVGSLDEHDIRHPSGSRIRHDGQMGGGLGINFFPIPYIGIMGDAYSEHSGGSFVDSTSGSLVLRLPIAETGLAPYIFGGGGYEFYNANTRFAQGGAGLEFRFTRCFSIFADARYVLPDHSRDYGVGRLGLRFNF